MNNNINELLQNRLKERLNEAQFASAEQTKEDIAADFLSDEKPTVTNTKVEPVANSDSDEIISSADVAVTVSNEPELKKAPEVGDELFDLQEVLDDSAQISAELQKQADEMNSRLDEEEDIVTDDIDTIIKDIEDTNKQTNSEFAGLDVDDIYERYQTQRVYGEAPRNEYNAGPSDYIVETNEDYLNTVDSILDSNNIKYNKVSQDEREAILNSFANGGEKVYVSLPNSGIYVKFAGAGIDELIAMNRIDTGSTIQDEIARLGHVCDHIVDTTVGPIKLSQLFKIVSLYDLTTLYYGLFAATHPDEIEVSRVCTRCHKEYSVKTNTRDLLLNYKDFERANTDIRDNVTTYSKLIETSKLGKIYTQKHSNGMIIFYRHPNIRSYLEVYQNLKPSMITQYDNIIYYAFSIERIAIPDTRNGKTGYVEIKNPNEILKLISSLRNPDDKEEIRDMIDSIVPTAVPSYGYAEMTCPHCQAKVGITYVNIPDLLFTLARAENDMAELRRAIKMKKKSENSKK